MFSSSEYVMAWMAYLVGSVGMMIVVWYLTRKITFSALRHLLQLVAAILMVTPYYADPQQPYLAPALIMALLEGIFEGPEAMWRAGIPLLATLFCGIVLLVIIELLWRKFCRKREQMQRLDQERQDLIAESKGAAPASPVVPSDKGFDASGSALT